MNTNTKQQNWTPLAGLYQWEREQGGSVYLTQPAAGEITEYTWSQVGDQVRRMAAHLKAQGFEPGSRIALISKNCAHWVMADLAIWMAGHVSVPIYPSLNADSVRFILEHSQSQLLMVGPVDHWGEMCAGVADELPIITLPGAIGEHITRDHQDWNAIIGSTEPLQESVTRDPEELATLVYTSGSTGRPKGVMISFRAMGAAVAEQIVPTSSSDRMLSYLPLAHVFEGSLVLNGSLRYGFKVYFNESLKTFIDDMRRAQPTLFLSVPRLWVKFQQAVQEKLPDAKLRRLLKIPLVRGFIRRKVLTQLGLQHVRFAASGSAPLPASVLSWYRDLGLELLEGYAMSENFAYSHGSLPGRSRSGYVGHPLPGVEQRIADNGEIQVKSPAQMSGYFRQPDKTREAFTDDGWFKTGDMGEIDADGRLKITGRVKELFKTSKGKYVAPAPIENRLGNHAAVEAVCVSGANLTKPFGLVMLNEDTQKQAADDRVREQLTGELSRLRESVNESVDPHEQLDFLVVVSEQWTVANGFLTPTLKIKRNVIEQRYEPAIENWKTVGEKVVWE